MGISQCKNRSGCSALRPGGRPAVAAFREQHARRLRQVVREADPPCCVHGAAATATIIDPKVHDAAAVDAYRGIGNRDLENLHGAAAEEQLGRPVGAVAGEVEARGVVAAGLHAERIRDVDVAAAPRAATSPTSGGRCSRCRIAERQ